MASAEHVSAVGQDLVDPGLDLTRRFRALFTLRNLGGAESIEWISKAFTDESALLKHELAYCLGQMQDTRAIPALTAVLKDTQQEPMVRHEAGEALGAIGDPTVLDLLKEYSQDPVIEVAETCQLAVRRVEWLQSGEGKLLENESMDKNPYFSVDPAPPAVRKSVSELRSILLDESLPLFERYRAMFALRNLGSKEAALALADGEDDGSSLLYDAVVDMKRPARDFFNSVLFIADLDGLQCSSTLFRHEIGYVLGQMQHPAAVPALCAALECSSENPMVRHEAAEALGAIGKEECLTVLQRYREDRERVVKESCEVALDMLEYENGDQFQYADGLVRLQS